jgi:hypothetical protein
MMMHLAVRQGYSRNIMTCDPNPCFAQFGIMIIGMSARPYVSHRVMGWAPSCPEVPRIKREGDALSSVTANYVSRKLDCYRCSNTRIYNGFKYRSKLSRAAFTSVYLTIILPSFLLLQLPVKSTCCFHQSIASFGTISSSSLSAVTLCPVVSLTTLQGSRSLFRRTEKNIVLDDVLAEFRLPPSMDFKKSTQT